MALVLANGFLFAGFHFLLPTITLYAASLGATGGEIGLIGGIFGYSTICIRLFTDTGVHYLGKKKCFYLGLAPSSSGRCSSSFPVPLAAVSSMPKALLPSSCLGRSCI